MANFPFFDEDELNLIPEPFSNSNKTCLDFKEEGDHCRYMGERSKVLGCRCMLKNKYCSLCDKK